jgi:hypothetical protein
MEFCTCLYCNKIINYTGGARLCKECDQKLFKIIKEYLRDNKPANLYVIHEATNIPVKIIKEFIKDSRLEQMQDGIKTCIGCGDIIVGDSKYCLKCMEKAKILKQLNSNFENKIDETKPKMHFINKNSGRKR